MVLVKQNKKKNQNIQAAFPADGNAVEMPFEFEGKQNTWLKVYTSKSQ